EVGAPPWPDTLDPFAPVLVGERAKMTAMHRLSHHRRAHRPAVLVPLAIAEAPRAVPGLALHPSHAPPGAGPPHRVSVRVAAIRAGAETAATAAGAAAAAA